AAARLDDVVHPAAVATHRLLVRLVPARSARKPSGRDGAPCAQSARRQAAAAEGAGASVPGPIHDAAGACSDWKLVAGGIARRISGRAAATALTPSSASGEGKCFLYESMVMVSFVKFSM